MLSGLWSLVSIKKRARQLKTCFNYRVLLSLPLEGKGDRSAVDEVTCTPAPLRGASALSLKQKSLRSSEGISEATTGFEPVMKVLQTFALPLGHVAINIKR